MYIPPEFRENINDNEGWSSNELFYRKNTFEKMLVDFIFQEPEQLQYARYFVMELSRTACKFSIFVDFFFILATFQRTNKNWLKIAYWLDPLQACLSLLRSQGDKLKLYYAIWTHFRRIKFLPYHEFGQKNTFYKTKKINRPHLLWRILNDYPEFW
jgi:hypothetical protein